MYRISGYDMDRLEFHIVGWCEEERFRKLAEELAKDCPIILHGEKTHSEVLDILGQCHCLLHPSYHEGMANVLMEASAKGRPCLASDIAGCREIVKDGESGLLFAPRDEKALRHALEVFLALDWETRRDMGLKARIRMEKEFDRRQVVEAYLERIEAVSNHPLSPGRIRGRDRFARYRTVILLLAKGLGLLPYGPRLRLFAFFRSTNGISGLVLRYVLLKTLARAVGDNVAVYPDAYILNPNNLVLGDNVSIQPFCYLECGNSGGIIIGNDVSLAHNVSIIATSHTFSNPDLPIRDQTVIERQVVIGNDVWIGAKATVLCGRRIGNHCVVGAGSVVTKDVEDGHVVAGVPARSIRQLSMSSQR